MRAGLARIATVSAVSAVIAAKISERKKYLARVGDHAGTELFFQGASGIQQFRQNIRAATQKLTRNIRRESPTTNRLANMLHQEG